MGRKVKVRNYVSGRRGSGYANGYMTVDVSVSRKQGERAKFGYEACATLSRPGGRNPYTIKHGRKPVDQRECATGSAPRRAIASALKKLATTLVRRSSAFRGR